MTIKNAEEARQTVEIWSEDTIDRQGHSWDSYQEAQGYLACLSGPEHKAALERAEAYREVAINHLKENAPMLRWEQGTIIDAEVQRLMAEKSI